MWRARGWLVRIALQALFGGILIAHQRLRIRLAGELTDGRDVATIDEWGHMGTPED
jgi:hypothetical protein